MDCDDIKTVLLGERWVYGKVLMCLWWNMEYLTRYST